MMMNSMHDIDELEKLERSTESSNQSESESSAASTPSIPNSMEGYRKIDRSDLPSGGALYPESWQFAYRCPTVKEVANFSTVLETDQPAIIQVTEDLIRRCVLIFDTANNKQISTGEICDAHRLYFLQLLRGFYIPDSPITIKAMCSTCKSQFDAHLHATDLKFKEFSEALLSAYDGRVFELHINGVTVKFRVPTIDSASKVFKYIVKSYRNQQQGQSELEKVVYDKQFLLFAPYLFETGKETIRELVLKFKNISRPENEKLFAAYLTVISNLHLENESTFDCECTECQSIEEVEVTFPGGYRQLFVSATDTHGYF